MANSIALFKQFVPLLDEVYKEASKTAVLDGRPELVQAGANANELVIPKMTMDGLADYSRNGGYVGGAMNLTNETVTCNFDRGRMFVVDHMDNADTAGVAFGMLAGEFIRTKVVPELDAFRFATYAGAAGVGSGSGTLNDGAAVVAALREAINAMDADEVPMEDRVLFITSGLLGKVEDQDTTKSGKCCAASPTWWRCHKPASIRPFTRTAARWYRRAARRPATRRRAATPRMKAARTLTLW